MDRIFFEELELPQPEFNLDVGSGLHGEQTGKILEGVEKILIQEKPDVVLVQGDTNTVLAGALAAAKLHIPVAHVEAGLRSFDRRTPEKINRVVADHVPDLLFAPTETAWRYLEDEGIPDEKIHVTVDAVFQNLEIAKKRQRISPGLEDLERGQYMLVTTHRAENVDVKKNLASILEGLDGVHRETGLPIIFPIHPRTEKMMMHFNLTAPSITLTKPLGYLEFLQLRTHFAKPQL
jgi:UDP-N-acetylglucosamine 2-epimerase (non-hydrolysing)